MKINYRQYKNSDYNNLLSFLTFIEKDFYPPLSDRMALENYLNDDLKKPSVTILAEFDLEIVGFINFHLNYPKLDECYINTIAVAPKFRKFGIGSELIKRTVKKAENFDFIILKTRTWSTNKSGLKLYEKFGFKTDYVVKDDRANAVDSIYLLKKL